MTFFDLILSTRASIHPDGEPDDFVSEYIGFIRAEGEDGIVRRVGKAHAYRINANLAAQYGESLFDVCDAHSQELHDVFAAVYDFDQEHFKKSLVDRFDAVDADCLVLDYIVLNPRWRGLKLGLLAARKLIDLAGSGCGLTVSYIAPLRHEAHPMLKVPKSWLPQQETLEEKKHAASKLRRYFRRMGFKRIGGTKYHAMPMARLMPTLSDLLRPSK